ncbi:MAG: hypothetical protein M3380_09615, partial [Chloroflexota bacterium]|nr:hypothetical protein [Chloroflexota bacterium]
LGTPAVTIIILVTAEMERIAGWIVQVLRNVDDRQLHERIADEVRSLCAAFPVPGQGRRLPDELDLPVETAAATPGEVPSPS